MACIKILVENGVDLNCTNIRKIRPIHLVIKNSSPSIIKYFLDIDSDCEDEDGKSVLWYACRYSTLEIVKELIKRGFEPKGKLIYAACYNKNTEIATYLIDLGLDYELGCKFFGNPIYLCCENNLVKILEKLIGLGVDLEYQTMTGLRPLHGASIHSNLECVKLLLESGAEINSVTNQKKNALHFACEKNSLEIVKYLIEKKIDSDQLDSDGKKPIEYTTCRKILNYMNNVDNDDETDAIVADNTRKIPDIYSELNSILNKD